MDTRLYQFYRITYFVCNRDNEKPHIRHYHLYHRVMHLTIREFLKIVIDSSEGDRVNLFLYHMHSPFAINFMSLERRHTIPDMSFQYVHRYIDAYRSFYEGQLQTYILSTIDPNQDQTLYSTKDRLYLKSEIPCILHEIRHIILRISILPKDISIKNDIYGIRCISPLNATALDHFGLLWFIFRARGLLRELVALIIEEIARAPGPTD
jgi:hypothetical protein